jgi:methylmalonyl-CoA mutase C-terminal domain/subunit
MAERVRVLIAKPGLDGHEAGAKLVARALRDAGMEVIYTGSRQTPQMIAESAIQEGVDVVGLSILSGAHKELSKRVIQELREREAGNIIVTVGGIIPEEDVPMMREMGVAEVFGPGSNTREIAEFIRRAALEGKDTAK